MINVRLATPTPNTRVSYSNVIQQVTTTTASGYAIGLLLALTYAGTGTTTTSSGGFGPNSRIASN